MAIRVAAIQLRGHFQGGAVVCGAHGRVLARRDAREGAGPAIAAIEPARVRPDDPLPERYWLRRRGPMSAFVWTYQRAHGRRWYAPHRDVVSR